MKLEFVISHTRHGDLVITSNEMNEIHKNFMIISELADVHSPFVYRKYTSKTEE